MSHKSSLLGTGVLFIVALYLLLNPVNIFQVQNTYTDNVSSFQTFSYNGSITDVSDIRVNATKKDQLFLTGYENGTTVTSDTINIEVGNKLYSDNLSFNRRFTEIEFDANQTGNVNLLESEITIEEKQSIPYVENLVALIMIIFGLLMAVNP